MSQARVLALAFGECREGQIPPLLSGVALMNKMKALR